MKKIIFLLLLCSVGLPFCRKKSIPPIDPCANSVPYKPDFLITENILDSIGTDSVLLYSYVSFVAPAKYYEYEWRFSNISNIYKNRTITIHFDERICDPEDIITVQFIGKYFYEACSLDRTGKNDTITKSFRVIPRKKAPIIGKYEGYFDSDKSKKEIVEIRFVDTIPEASCYPPLGCMRLFNINKGCNTVLTNGGPYPQNVTSLNLLTGARFMSFDAFTFSGDFSNNCKAPKGYIRLKTRDTLVAVFAYSESITNRDNRIQDRFIGVRQ